MIIINKNSNEDVLEIGQHQYYFFNIVKAASMLNIDINRLPYSVKILLENALRNQDNISIGQKEIESIAKSSDVKSECEFTFYPSRVLMQDFTGVPAIVDLAAMRDAMKSLKNDPKKINPLIPVDLVIDHSVQVDSAKENNSFKNNVDLEMNRNRERYEFLKWGQKEFNNFRVVPPGTGICHQVNLEYLAQVVWLSEKDGKTYAYPDSLVGTDSHTTMVNGLAVLGWGVGGIEAEAAMLGQGISMLMPEVIGFELTNKLKEGVTATDLVLNITQILRKKNVVNKFVEFYGSGLDNLKLADRATIANMAPEYGATCGFFPIDQEVINYLKLTSRDDERINLVEQYAKAQGMWRDSNSPKPIFTDTLSLDLSTVKASVSGPKRPQDRVNLEEVFDSFDKTLTTLTKNVNYNQYQVKNKDYTVGNGSIIIAAITSCTNTSNPSVMIGAALVAKAACELGIDVKPWVKTSLAPGSQVVTEYLSASGLDKYLDKLGFNLVGYGCTTCIGNSGPIDIDIENTIIKNELAVVSVLSGNRNFEGRIHSQVKANYLMSPPLVVVYSLAGRIDLDVSKDIICLNKDGKAIYLKDLWPQDEIIDQYMKKYVNKKAFKERYSNVFKGDQNWQAIKLQDSELYNWDKESTYINNPPYFKNIKDKTSALRDIKNARLLAIFGDSITTDHISPAGNIAKGSPAAKYLLEKNVEPIDFNSYGSRRGNHEVMMRGTFANIRIKNQLAGGVEGGLTKYYGEEELISIYDAAMKYMKNQIPLIVIAGKEYGTGSSRDWAAKGTYLQGIRAVIAESFERIHRSNLVGMGVIPFTFTKGDNKESLKLNGSESFDIVGLDKVRPLDKVNCIINRSDKTQTNIELLCRIDTENELNFLYYGGILQSVIFTLAN